MNTPWNLRLVVLGAGGVAALLLLLASAPASSSHASGGPPFTRDGRQCERGEITEVLPAGPYSYIAYTTAEGEARWLASLALRDAPAPGSTADFVRYGTRQGFHSNRLGRDFPVLFFGHLGTC